MPLTQADANLVVETLVKDRNFQALIWRVHAMEQMTPTTAGGPTAAEENKLTTALAAIPTTALPSGPISDADKQDIANRVLAGLNLVQKAPGS